MQKLIRFFQQSYLGRYQYTAGRVRVSGVVGAVGFPLFYVWWVEWFPQPYENLTLRIFLGLICLGLALDKLWPTKVRGYLPLYAYVTQFLALSVFFNFMLLMNDGNAIWSVSLIMAIFFLVAFVDIWNAILMYVVGALLAMLIYGCFFASAGQFPEHVIQLQPVYLLALIGGSLFNYVESAINQERHRVMMALSANMAHELRTPLLSVRSLANGIEKALPTLLQAYEWAKNKGFELEPIRDNRLQMLETSTSAIRREVDDANRIIDIVVNNVRTQVIDDEDFARFSASVCVAEAINRYNLSADSGIRIELHVSRDFEFWGSELLLKFVIFNLLRNSVYAIQSKGVAASDGLVSITIEQGVYDNFIKVWDNGSGISPNKLDKIFIEFYTSKTFGVGTGLGLAFCKRVLDAFGGGFYVKSEEGKFTEFTLSFQRLENAKD